jgi:protein TonB
MDEIASADVDPLFLLIDDVEVPRAIVRRTAKATSPQRSSQGTAIVRVEPKFPPRALAEGVFGTVVVEVVVDEDGNVLSARALSGHPLLEEAAVNAALEWKFKPTTLNGISVKVKGNLTFAFKE